MGNLKLGWMDSNNFKNYIFNYDTIINIHILMNFFNYLFFYKWLE